MNRVFVKSCDKSIQKELLREKPLHEKIYADIFLQSVFLLFEISFLHIFIKKSSDFLSIYLQIKWTEEVHSFFQN